VRNTVIGVILILLIAVCALFALQNSSRVTQLSLDLGFFAWQLKEPVSVPALIGISFGSGALLTGLFMLLPLARANSRVRDLEQQATLRQFGSQTSTSPSREPGGW
jgi:uncharacterized integral membrane protein